MLKNYKKTVKNTGISSKILNNGEKTIKKTSKILNNREKSVKNIEKRLKM